jgi:hypothetical protein
MHRAQAAITETFEVREGFALIKTLDAFRAAIKKDSQKIRVKPGIYRAEKVDLPMMAPIPRNQMIPLTEDEVRSYGGDKNMMVVHTTVERMRGCFQLFAPGTLRWNA